MHLLLFYLLFVNYVLKIVYVFVFIALLKAFNTILENKNQFSLQKKMFCEVLMFELWKFPSIRVLANFI